MLLVTLTFDNTPTFQRKDIVLFCPLALPQKIYQALHPRCSREWDLLDIQLMEKSVRPGRQKSLRLKLAHEWLELIHLHYPKFDCCILRDLVRHISLRIQTYLILLKDCRQLFLGRLFMSLMMLVSFVVMPWFMFMMKVNRFRIH